MKITVLHNQSLLDVALRHCGTVKAVVDIVILNNISITDELIPGQLIELPNKDYGSQEVVNFFATNKVEPATAITQSQIDELEANGIGYMIIEETFIVS